jgi:hypothetical protein
MEDAKIETMSTISVEKVAESEDAKDTAIAAMSTTHNVSDEKRRAKAPTQNADLVDKIEALLGEARKGEPSTASAELIDKIQTLLGGDGRKGETAWPDPKQPSTPDARKNMTPPADSKFEDPTSLPKCVYLALDFSLCIGVFTNRTQAWEACTKHKTQIMWSVDLQNEKQWVDKDLMPHLQGTLPGGSIHHWTVRKYIVDGLWGGRKD